VLKNQNHDQAESIYNEYDPVKRQLPQFEITLGDEKRFVYSEDELIEIKREDEFLQRKQYEETIASIPEDERTEEMKVFLPKTLHFTELYDLKTLKKIEAGLKDWNLTLEDYFQTNKDMFDIVEEGGSITTVTNLKQVIEFLRSNGRKGIEIQRYKGLGEMNPDQLWHTTMDPEKRTLVKVRVEDAVEADNIFTILMGDKVEPRREFIQKNALEVTELDI